MRALPTNQELGAGQIPYAHHGVTTAGTADGPYPTHTSSSNSPVHPPLRSHERSLKRTRDLEREILQVQRHGKRTDNRPDTPRSLHTHTRTRWILQKHACLRHRVKELNRQRLRSSLSPGIGARAYLRPSATAWSLILTSGASRSSSLQQCIVFRPRELDLCVRLSHSPADNPPARRRPCERYVHEETVARPCSGSHGLRDDNACV